MRTGVTCSINAETTSGSVFPNIPDVISARCTSPRVTAVGAAIGALAAAGMICRALAGFGFGCPVMQSRLTVAHHDEGVAMRAADDARAVAVGPIMANNGMQAAGPCLAIRRSLLATSRHRRRRLDAARQAWRAVRDLAASVRAAARHRTLAANSVTRMTTPGELLFRVFRGDTSAEGGRHAYRKRA